MERSAQTDCSTPRKVTLKTPGGSHPSNHHRTPLDTREAEDVSRQTDSRQELELGLQVKRWQSRARISTPDIRQSIQGLIGLAAREM